MSNIKQPPEYGVPSGPVIKAFIRVILSSSVLTNMLEDNSRGREVEREDNSCAILKTCFCVTFCECLNSDA